MPEYVGHHLHYKIRVQQRQKDGTFYDINSHWVWHIVPGLFAVPSPATAGTISWNPQNSIVMETMNNISYNMNLGITLAA